MLYKSKRKTRWPFVTGYSYEYGMVLMKENQERNHIAHLGIKALNDKDKIFITIKSRPEVKTIY